MNLFKEEINVVESLYKINLTHTLCVQDYVDMMHDKNHELYYKDLSLNKLEAYCLEHPINFSVFWDAIHIVMSELKGGVL
jgi:hypothetical protein